MKSTSILREGGVVLAVDDQPENLELVAEILMDEGYKVTTAADGEAALRSVEAEPPDCIVLDVMMPRLDGYSVCHRLKSRRQTHFIPIVMLTALSEVDDKVTAFEVGADDFLNKPVHSAELVARVRSLVRIKRLRDELDTSESIVFSMIQALESKDRQSAGHSQRVAAHAIRLARRLGLPPDRVEVVAKGAILHDVGKIGVRDRFLWPTAGGCDEETLAAYQQHPILGEQILSPLASFAPVRALVRHHHERLDGSGYPDGLSGSSFDLETEVVALANLYDNLALQFDRHEETAEALRAAARRGEFQRELVEEVLRIDTANLVSSGVGGWLDLLPVQEGGRTGRILVADDTAGNREVLEEILSHAGHEVYSVGSGGEALAAIRDVRPDLVLVDVNMPDLDGFSVCGQLKDNPETAFLPVILVTAHHDLRDRVRSAGVGADDFLLYPINRLELVARVKSLLRLRLYFRDLEEYQSVILSVASAIEAKDPYTHGHSARVGALAARVAAELGLPAADQELMVIAGQLHDVGKIGIPESVLHKPGRLTDEEREIIKTHPAVGEEICRPLRSVRATLPAIRHHHEKIDGSGYPDGLAGNAIPFIARLLGVVDAFDALTSKRSYRTSLTIDRALEILVEETEAGRWDPEVYEGLERVVRRELVPE